MFNEGANVIFSISFCFARFQKSKQFRKWGIWFIMDNKPIPENKKWSSNYFLNFKLSLLFVFRYRKNYNAKKVKGKINNVESYY